MTLPGAESTDPYGDMATELLLPLSPDLASLAPNVADKLYETLAGISRTADIIARLRPEEFKRLKQRQAQHVIMLLSADLTRAAHLIEAQRAGHAHAMVGIDALWLIEAYNLYQDEIHKLLQSRVPPSESREKLMRIVCQRVLLDLEGQMSSYRAIDAEITAAFSRIDRHAMSTPNLTDLARGALEVIGELSGEVCAFFARVDDAGELQIEQSQGLAAEQYHLAMEAGKVPKISIDPTIVAGRGPGGRAWRSGEITVSDAWLIESDKAPWKSVGEALGFRSSAAVPLHDESGRSIALLSLYSAWPGYFSTGRIRGFFSHVQQILSHAIQQSMSSPVIPLREQQAYRQMLNEKRVVMHYQPIIDLRDGNLTKVEALARICSSDGELISPQRFLPALGGEELLLLFVQGLEQACTDFVATYPAQPGIRIAINFPAEGFDDPRYENALFRTLDKFGLPPTNLQLEVLETKDAGDGTESRQAFLQRLRDAGIQIAQDDLGSGHSSLLRLEQYPFDEVKIDQGLVRGALHNPKRAVEFILYLTRLAHAFNIPVTVEGLENLGMIEAAAILGADRGQGYGIAKPMPATELTSWQKNHHYQVQAQKPRTAIGAMAGYLLWDLQLSAISERPELIAEFVGAKAIVDQFIETNNLQGGPIDQLLRRNHELAATSNDQHETAKIVRAQLIKELTEYWLSETS